MRPQQPRPADSGRSAGNGRLLRLGSVLGVPVFVTPSWLLVAAFVTVSYGGFLKDQIAGASAGLAYSLALLYAVLLAASVLLHELGHTVVSRLLGIRVRRIVIFLLGGVSEIDGEARRPREEFAIAGAGPLVSLLLGGGCWLASRWPASQSAAEVLLTLLAWSNIVIAVFNALPGLPLDGGRLVQAVVWAASKSRLTGVRIAAWGGRTIAVLLALLILVGNALLGGGRTVDLGLVTSTALGFALSAFLWFGASQTLRAAEMGVKADALRLAALIRPSVYLPSATPVSEALRRASEQRAAGIVVVDAAGRTQAIVGEADIARVQPRQQPWSTLAQVSRALEPGLLIADDLSGAALLQAVRKTPATEYLVVGRDGVCRGVLATSDVARALGLQIPD